MPEIPWKTLVKMLEEAAKASFGTRNDPAKWEANFKPEDDAPQTKANVKAVSLEAATGLRLELDKDGTPVVIHAKPSSTARSKIDVNGDSDPDARMVFAYKGTILNPTRYAFDFKRITLDGEEYRVDTRFDP